LRQLQFRMVGVAFISFVLVSCILVKFELVTTGLFGLLSLLVWLSNFTYLVLIYF